MNLWRIAWGIAMNPSRESRWRQISVVVSVLIATVLLLSAASVLTLRAREDNRKAGQVAVLSSTPASSDVLLLSSADEWRGQRIDVISVEPGPGAGRPPGLARWPESGEFAVSPALARLAGANPGLARRYPAAMAIGSDGVRTGGDLLVYHTLEPGTLHQDDTVLRIENGAYVGSGPIARVSDFGPTRPGAAVLGLTPPSTGTLSDVAAGSVIALVLPALVVLGVGLSSGSVMRTGRFQILHALGVSSAVRRRIAAVETLVLSAPSAVLAVIGWSLISGRLDRVPFVEHRVVPGDLAPPWWGLLAVLLIALLAVSLVAISGTAMRRPRVASARPSGQRTVLSWLALVPSVIAVAAFAVAKLIGGEVDATYFFIGTASAVVGTPLLMPALLRSAGSVVAGSKSPAGSLVGRAMMWDPARSGRPFVGLGAALVLILAATGYVGLARFTEPPPGLDAGPQAVAVQWRGAGPDALGAHAGDLSALVVPYAAVESASVSESTLRLGVSCSRLAPVVGGACSAVAPYDIAPETTRVLLAMLGPLGLGDGLLVDVVLTPDDLSDSVGGEPEHADTERALVLAVRPLGLLDEQVRNVSSTALPVSSVSSLLRAVQPPSPLITWIQGGLTVALSAIVIACVLSLVDRLLAVRRHHLQLVHIGASPRQLAALGAWLFSAPYAVVCLASATAGILVCNLIVRPIVPMPWPTIAAVLVLVFCCGAFGALATVIGGSKSMSALRD